MTDTRNTYSRTVDQLHEMYLDTLERMSSTSGPEAEALEELADQMYDLVQRACGEVVYQAEAE